jgi:hypothetical protein
MPEKQKSYTPEELFQKIEDLTFLDDIQKDPERFFKMFVSNIVQHAISHLLGYTGTKWTPISVTAGGVVKTAPAGSGFETLERHDYSAVATEQTQAFTEVAGQVWVMATSGNVSIKFSPDGVTFGDAMLIQSTGNLVIDITCHTFKVNKWINNFTGYVWGLW